MPILSVSDKSESSDLSPVTPISNVIKGESDTDLNVSMHSTGASDQSYSTKAENFAKIFILFTNSGNFSNFANFGKF